MLQINKNKKFMKKIKENHITFTFYFMESL